MSLAVAEEPRIVHTLPGRVRVHLPGWAGHGQLALEAALRRVRGVSDVRSSPLTRNVLVRFDPEEANDESILAAARELGERVEEEPEAPPVLRERRDPKGRRASRFGAWIGIPILPAAWWSGWRVGLR